MKGKLLGLAAVAALAFGFATTGAHAQSAKFDATWSDDPVMIDTGLVTTANGPIPGAETDIATLHVAQNKDLLIGVSAEIGILTFTKAKGKGDGGETTAIADGSVKVTLHLEDVDGVKDDQVVVPGIVTLAARLQELTVSALTADGVNDTVTVSLLLDTTAAHHFNFLAIDVPQGTWDVVAEFDLSAFADVIGTLADGSAQTKVVLGKRVVTVQEVRAVRGGIIEDTN